MSGFKSVGFRDAVIYDLNASGRPNAQSVSVPYVGTKVNGPKVFTLNMPNPRIIQHTGNDRVLEVDQLPTLEQASGEIRMSGVDQDLDALLSGVDKFTVGHTSFLARMTDKQGTEPQVGVVAWQQSLLEGLRRWHIYLIPSSRAIPIPAGMGDSPEDHRFSLAPNPTDRHLWGVELDEGTEGAEEFGVLDGYSTIRPVYPLVAFKTDGIEDTFVFTDYPADDNTYPVWVNGALVSSGVTKTTTQVVFDYPPAAGDLDIWIV